MPGNVELFQKSMNEGHSAAWDQEWRKAASAYRAALQEMPDHPKALNSLGLALYQQGSFDESLQIYLRSAKVSPQDPSPLEKLAQLFERTGRLKEAIEAATRAADLFLNQRDVDKGIENWVRVTSLDPEHILAHSRLAVAHERLGHKPQAVTEYLAVASLVQRTGNAQKTAELIRTHAHGEKAVVVGLSEGAQVAVQLLATENEVVEKAIITSALLRLIPGLGWINSPALLGWMYRISIPPFRNVDWWIRLNMKYAAGIPRARPTPSAGS